MPTLEDQILTTGELAALWPTSRQLSPRIRAFVSFLAENLKVGALIETFGRNVRQARKGKGWPQEQLAFEAGVKRAYLSEVENGQRNVSLDIVEKLAKALDVSPEGLMLP